MADLGGAEVALLERRQGGELAELIRRHGGRARRVPAGDEAPLDGCSQVAALLDGLSSGRVDIVVLQTGVGTTALFELAGRLERLAELRGGLERSTLVCRGPKPAAALRQHGLSPNLVAAAPYTSRELLEQLGGLELEGRTVALVHYGERDQRLPAAIGRAGAEIVELCLYEWRLPRDLTALRRLVTDLAGGGVEAVMFTSQVQARHLFLVADELDLADRLAFALNNRTVVASVGPTCTAFLQSLGVTTHVEPAHPKMGPLVIALADYLARERAVSRGQGRTAATPVSA